MSFRFPVGFVRRGGKRLCVVFVAEGDPSLKATVTAAAEQREDGPDLMLVEEFAREAASLGYEAATARYIDMADWFREMRTRYQYETVDAAGAGIGGAYALLFDAYAGFDRVFALAPRFLDGSLRSLIPWDLTLLRGLHLRPPKSGRYLIDPLGDSVAYSQLATLRDEVDTLMPYAPLSYAPADAVVSAVVECLLDGSHPRQHPALVENTSFLDA